MTQGGDYPGSHGHGDLPSIGTSTPPVAPVRAMQPSGGMPSSFLEDVVRTHRVENAKREAGWIIELEERRRECAKRACIDVDALRDKLAI